MKAAAQILKRWAKQKAKRLAHVLIESFGMMVVVCGPVIPMVVVSYAYKSYFNYGFTNKVPMDKQFHVVSDVIITLAVVGLISNFAAFFKAKTGISFVFWKKAILPFTIISI